MAKKQTSKPVKARKSIKKTLVDSETDGEYFLKLVLFVLLGTFWLKFSQPLVWGGLTIAAVPVGLFLGLIFVSYFEKFQTDRKIWYAVLIVVGIISYFEPAGILI